VYLALVITLLIALVLAVGACSVGGIIWAYRRVSTDRAEWTAVLASLAFGGVVFMGGWLLFAPAWVGGWLRRRFRSGDFRIRSSRFVLAVLSVVGIGIMVIGVGEVLQDRTDARHGETLRTRGTTATAQVLSADYDANGGDPNGWTSIRARFTDVSGRAYVVTIGHHDKGTERPGDAIAIIYDSAHPTLAEMATDPQYVQTDNGFLVIGVGTATTGAVMAALFLYLMLQRRSRPPAGWYSDPHRIMVWRFWDGQAWTGYVAP
jgi:hypothetical protein